MVPRVNENPINLSYYTIEEISEQVRTVGGHDLYFGINQHYSYGFGGGIATLDQANTNGLQCKHCLLPRVVMRGLCIFCFDYDYYGGDMYSQFGITGRHSNKKHNAATLFWWFDKSEQGEFYIHNYDRIQEETNPKRLRELAIEFRPDERRERQSIEELVIKKLDKYKNSSKMYFSVEGTIWAIEDEDLLEKIISMDYPKKFKDKAKKKLQRLRK